MKPVTTEIKSRGRLTIPKKIRVMSQMEEGQVVSIIPVGDSVVITPKRLDLDEAGREMRKILKGSGLAVEDLLEGLKAEREKVYQETYGKKNIKMFYPGPEGEAVQPGEYIGVMLPQDSSRGTGRSLWGGRVGAFPWEGLVSGEEPTEVGGEGIDG